MSVREGFHTVTPYLTTSDLDGLLAFMNVALGATETLRGRGGSGAHVEMRVGDSMIMVGGGIGASRPQTAMLFLYVADPDSYYERSLAAGATSLMPPANLPDGRRCGVEDAFGNKWFFGAAPGATRSQG
jgi:PhnB protein